MILLSFLSNEIIFEIKPMNLIRQALGSLFFLFISIILVLFYAFFIPSLGHLQELGLGEMVVNLDLLAPWGMAISAVLIVLLCQGGRAIGIPELSSKWSLWPVVYFVILWVERTSYIARDSGTITIWKVFFLALIWIPFFLKATGVISMWASVPEGEGKPQLGTAWTPLFFWIVVFFSFATQLLLNGYGNWGLFQALVFLGLSYREHRRLGVNSFLSRRVLLGFEWIYRVAFLIYLILLFSKILSSW